MLRFLSRGNPPTSHARLRLRVPVLAVGFVLLAGACGDDSDSTAAPATAAPATAAPATAAPTTTEAVDVEPIKVNMRLDFYVAGNYHSPFYVALEGALYSDLGLDVSVREGEGSTTTAQLVAAGNDDFGLVTAEAMLRTIAAGADLVAVANIMPRTQACVVVKADSGIESLKDLEGRKVGQSPGSTTEALFPLMLSEAGVDIEKIELISVSSSVGLPAFLADEIDAWMMLGFSRPVVLELDLGIKTRCFAFDDYGLDTLGWSIITRREVIEDNPEMVRAFVEASLAGFAQAMADPVGTSELMIGRFGLERLASPEVIQQQIRNVAGIVDLYGTGRLGFMRLEDWETTLELLQTAAKTLGKGSIPAIDVSRVFTNEFIPEG